MVMCIPVVNYQTGERNGKYIFYYDNGKRKEEGNYKNDKYKGQKLDLVTNFNTILCLF